MFFIYIYICVCEICIVSIIYAFTKYVFKSILNNSSKNKK